MSEQPLAERREERAARSPVVPRLEPLRPLTPPPRPSIADSDCRFYCVFFSSSLFLSCFLRWTSM